MSAVPRSASSSSSLTLAIPAPAIPLKHMDIPIVPSKGHIQPHVNNLPRRRRRAPTAAKIILLEVDEEDQPKSSTSLAANVPSPLSHALNDLVPATHEADASPSSQSPPIHFHHPTPHGALQPHATNLPRRGTRNPAQLQRRACLQPLSNDLSVAFAGVPTDGYDHVIHIAPGEEAGAEETADALRLAVTADVSDEGIAHLSPAQLAHARTYYLASLRERRAHALPPPRVLIAVPRDRAVDAMSVAACLLAAAPETHALAAAADLHGNTEAEAHSVHAVLMAINALDEDALRPEWRGAVSREGMDYVQAVIDSLDAEVV